MGNNAPKQITQEEADLYCKTARRLERMGIKDPTAQIVALAEEIEYYRGRVKNLLDLKELQEKQVAGPAEFAEIVNVPICSNCHAVIAEETIEMKANGGEIIAVYSIYPPCCPECSAIFTASVQNITE